MALIRVKRATRGRSRTVELARRGNPDVVGGMLATHSGSIQLFRFSGIQVYLHWSWFLVAVYEITTRAGTYSSVAWNAAEYVTLFAIVTLHEFGHALACRQTGGQAHEIVLWPLGGIAYVSPPQRAGAVLWSIAAGPLVNVLLIPVFTVALWLSARTGNPDLVHYTRSMDRLNTILLIFNLLPVYPLDGGQILRAFLWFGLGRRRSLLVAAVIGLAAVGAAGLFLLFIGIRSGGTAVSSMLFPAIMLLFIGSQCWAALQQARVMRRLEQLPRHPECVCPSCHVSPPGGPLWGCPNCRRSFDPFSTNGMCPHCGLVQSTVPCPNCGTVHDLQRWRRQRPEPPVINI